jgi:hypothetical protein
MSTSSTSRRKFIKGATIVALAAGVPMKILAGQSAGSLITNLLAGEQGASDLNSEVFARHLNTRFVIKEGSRDLTLTLVEVRHWKNSSTRKDGKECFSLMFQSSDVPVKQNTYRTTHSVLGQLELFVVPTGKSSNATVYESLFNRLH